MEPFSKVNSDLQNIIFKKVVELSFENYSYNKIIKFVLNKYSVRLSKGTLSYWFNNDIKLFGGKNKFIPKSSSELSYLLGVMFGDGAISKYEKSGDYSIRLCVIDKDFSQKFSKYVSKVLNKEKVYPVHKTKRGNYEVNIRSKEMYYFIKSIKNDFEKVKPFAEKFPKEFIQGLADSEGCPFVCSTNNFYCGVIVASSANEKLMHYVVFLLEKYFGIKSKNRLTHIKGKSDSSIGGRLITRKKNVFSLKLNSINDSIKFYNLIGFSIKRKQIKLKDGLFIFDKYSGFERIIEWKKLYFKNKKQWVKLPNKSSTIDV